MFKRQHSFLSRMKQQKQEKTQNVLGITFIGFEAVAGQEVEEILSKKATAGKGIIMFSATDNELAELCYKTQTLRRVLRLWGKSTIEKESTLEDCKKQWNDIIKKQDLSFFSGKTFCVVCERQGEHGFTSRDAAALLGECILEQQQKAKVNLEDPDIIVFCFLRGNECCIGIDFAGFDLSKREYKIYNQTNTPNAGFAYCTVRFAGYAGKEVLLDPLCGVGILPLEAALFTAQVSPRFHQKELFLFNRFLKKPIDLSTFDGKEKEEKKTKREKKKEEEEKNEGQIIGFDVHLRNVEAAKKHAKLAGVEKAVRFARADMEWIDTKVEEKSVDIIVAQMPVEGKAIPERELEKFYKELFYQLEFVLKDAGKMVLLCQKTAVLKKMLQHFSIVDEHAAYQGEQEFVLVTLKKKK